MGNILVLVLALLVVLAGCGSEAGDSKAAGGRKQPASGGGVEASAGGDDGSGGAVPAYGRDEREQEWEDEDEPEFESHEEGIEEKENLVAELSVVLATVTDVESAKEARPLIDDLRKRATLIHARMKKIGPMDEDTKAENTKRMVAALGRYREVKNALPADPEVKKVLGNYDIGQWPMGK